MENGVKCQSAAKRAVEGLNFELEVSRSKKHMEEKTAKEMQKKHNLATTRTAQVC